MKRLLNEIVITFLCVSFLAGCLKGKTIAPATEEELEILEPLYSQEQLNAAKNGKDDMYLELLREIVNKMHNKYPDSEFTVISMNPGMKIYDQGDVFTFQGEDGRIYSGEYKDEIWKDDFYASIYQDEYDKRIKEVLASHGLEAEVYTVFSNKIGDEIMLIEEFDDLMQLKIMPYSHVFLTSDVDKGTLDQIKQELYDGNHTQATYQLFKTDTLTEINEMEKNRKNMERIAFYS